MPIGVVGAISPFNFPLNLVAHKLAPAIAAGCPVVLKPASQTPFSGIALAELLIDDCGLPAEWLHVVTGGGSTVGNALVDHDDIALITFTGSPDVGWGIRGRAPRKKVGLELGNNAPGDHRGRQRLARRRRRRSRSAGFSHAGQSCISTQRILVHADIADEFIDALVKEVSSLVVGDPMDEATDVSALISERRARPGQGVDRRGRRRRAPRSPTAARSTTDGVLGPTVLTGVTPDDEGVLAGGLRAGRRRRHLRRPRRGAAAGQRHALRPAGGRRRPPRNRSFFPGHARRCRVRSAPVLAGIRQRPRNSPSTRSNASSRPKAARSNACSSRPTCSSAAMGMWVPRYASNSPTAKCSTPIGGWAHALSPPSLEPSNSSAWATPAPARSASFPWTGR